MAHEKLRREILFETARLLQSRQETSIGRARIQAARKLYKGWVKPADMPSDQEILIELDRMSHFHQPAPEDRFALFHKLLAALEQVRQPKSAHPEGDALVHSLQVYDLVCDAVPYDEELLLAALLHDVGKSLDPLNHVTAGLVALGDSISPRTRWLIEHCHEARRIKDGSIGSRARKRLQANENYEDVLFLAECDLKGRVAGLQTSDVDEALDHIRSLEDQFG